MTAKWMIYGANGYTGRLVAQLAYERGHRPVLAGRSEAKLAQLNHLGLPQLVVDLDDTDALEAALSDIDAVLHAAGPFSATSAPMVQACLESKTHYLDITGEIDVFEAVHARDDEALRAGVALIPGVGFDVVPTDAMAAMLAAQLDDPTDLELAFAGLGESSAGTTKTMVEGLPKGGRARIDGRIEQVPVAWRRRRIPFHDKEREAVSIPWGDVSTAFYSTGIGNICAYMAMPPAMAKAAVALSKISPVLALTPVQRGLKKLVELTVKGPNEQSRRRGRSEIWGEVRNAAGQRISGTMTTPEGYSLTADGCVKSIERVLEGVAAGALTPSKAFGAEFVKTLDGVTVHAFQEQ